MPEAAPKSRLRLGIGQRSVMPKTCFAAKL